MTTASSSSLVDGLRQYRLLDSKQLEELKSFQEAFPDPKALAGELIRRGWLTPYQANQVLQGRGHELLLGSYILLEKLGEGGMGQVFKARNWKLGRIVALKLIRKERLDNPDSIRRFEREVRSAAALSHPNIVHAYDADQIGGTHLLVIEYVEGTDLAKLVKKNGPLPVPQACECIRQAAMGLQHAYERGLVHRDIKPANLLLTADGKMVKVLDMGLARLDHPGTDDDKSSTMTQEGMVMGTADYIAPEQALESHTVDIRGDLYSLGCTFYYLLTGKVPFPGGTLLQKLNKHQFEEAKPVEALRPEVPPSVAAVVRKMMAKRPEDRFQTPAEMATALASPWLTEGDDRTISEGSQPVVEASGDTVGSPFASLRTEESEQVHRKIMDQRLLLGMVGGSLLLVVVGMLLFVFLKGIVGKKPPVDENTQPDVASKKPLEKVDDAWLKQVAAMPAEKQVETVAAKLKELNPGFDGKVTHKVDNGVVADLNFLTDNVKDISPVRALKGLKGLRCSGSAEGKGRLSDLSPVNGMKLTGLECVGTQVADLSPLKGMKLEWLGCSATKVSDLSPLNDMKLKDLACGNTKVSDLSPLKDMKLTELNCTGTQVTDLSPLKDMKLTVLSCYGTQVIDLSPLKEMKLTHLICGNTQVSDLSPLQGMKLMTLDCYNTQVSDLSPLKHMMLTVLSCQGTKVSDLSPLKGMPIKTLNCDFKPFRDTEILRSIMTLKTINGKSTEEFWKEVDEKQAAYEAWCKQVAAMPVDKQRDAVTAKLKELNPGFDDKVTHKIEGGVVTEFGFITDNVTNISPVRALIGLQTLNCSGTHTNWQPKGLLADLSPLKDMKLTKLNCGFTKVSDLSPLKDMKLTFLCLSYTAVSDLSPLKGMPLTALDCHDSKVSDLLPLKDMKLTHLYCENTQASDLSPLKGMPLVELRCDFRPYRDTDILRSIKTLEWINEKPAKEFWKEVDEKQAAFEAWCKQVSALPVDKQAEAVGKKLKELNPGFDGKVTHKIEGGVVTELDFITDNVTDISPVRVLRGLRTLNCSGNWGKGLLADLGPLKEMKLTSLICYGTEVSDLSTLKDMKLTILHCDHTKVVDLSPLKDMKLTFLDCRYTQVSDLSPLKDMNLTTLFCTGTQVSNLSPLKDMMLTNLQFTETQVSDLSPLKNMKLTTITFNSTKVQNLLLLKDMPLTTLHFQHTQISDLTPLKNMKLIDLWCDDTQVSDLTPLKDMKLTYLSCHHTSVSDLSPLKGMPLKELQCDFKPERDAEILRSIKTLEKINGKPVKDFWKENPHKYFTNSIGMKFVWIPPGTFLMGSPKVEKGRNANENQHKVTLTKEFYLGVYAVTQENWQAVMGNNPSHFNGEKNLPVETVSWDDCQAFIKKLREKDKQFYRLPTEAEWEYACRAGTTTPFHFGETISTDQANYDGDSIYANGKKGVFRKKTTPVGSFPANAWGLHDMQGNVWQWGCIPKKWQ